MKNGKMQELLLLYKELYKRPRHERLEIVRAGYYEKPIFELESPEVSFNTLKSARIKSLDKSPNIKGKCLWFDNTHYYEVAKGDALAGPRGKLP